MTSLPSPETCTWCEDAPAVGHAYDEHNGAYSWCDDCKPEDNET